MNLEQMNKRRLCAWAKIGILIEPSTRVSSGRTPDSNAGAYLIDLLADCMFPVPRGRTV
jgi:hypothetical protein